MILVLLFSFDIENVFKAIIFDDTVPSGYAVIDLTVLLCLQL